LLLFINTAIFANITLDKKNQNIEILHVEYFEDKSNSLSLAEIQKQNFLESTGVVSFGFSESTFWFKIPINSTKKSNLFQWWFSVNYPLLYEVDLYKCDENLKVISIEKSGKMRPFKDRSLKNRNFIFDINPKVDKVLYLRVLTQSSMQVPMRIQTTQALVSQEQISLVLSGVYYGMFVLIFFYNFICYFIYNSSFL